MNRLACLVVLLAVPAFADIPPSDTAGCGGKAIGDSCKTDSDVAGSCVTSTCSRNDYSNGPPPKRVTYECMKCQSSAAEPAPAPVAVAPKEEKKSSSCAVAPFSVFGALVVLLLRRRKS